MNPNPVTDAKLFSSPIAFHPASVLFETPLHNELMEKMGVKSMISDVIDELLQIANSQGCNFEHDFKDRTMQRMSEPTETNSIMYQDFTARRPMEVETYLGSPIKLAMECGVRVPRIETLYALLHHCNIMNQQKPPAGQVSSNLSGTGPPPPRLSSTGPGRPPMNGGMNGPPSNGGSMRGGRTPSMGGPPMRRGPGPPMTNGYPRNSNGFNPRGPPNQLNQRPSLEEEDLNEFSHLMLYEDIPEGGLPTGYGDMGNPAGPNPSDLAFRERELALRQRELQLREREYNFRRGPRRPPPSNHGGFDEDEDDDDFFDPMEARGPPMAPADVDNVDMMSVTSRKTRKAPSLSQIRNNPEHGIMGRNGGGVRSSQTYGGRPPMGRNRGSAQMLSGMPGLHDSLMDDPMMGYSSNRYGNVDRKTMGEESRTNSLTAARLQELQGAGNNAGMNGAYPTPATPGMNGAYPTPATPGMNGAHPNPAPPGLPRRTSHSPGNPFRNVRPPPTDDRYMGPGRMQPNGGPSPPGMMRQPVPRYPPGQGNAVAPQQVEQHAGVSNQYPPKGPVPKTVRSLTGSASASAGSGDSASAHNESDPSAHSSQSSLAPHQAAIAAARLHGRPVGVQ